MATGGGIDPSDLSQRLSSLDNGEGEGEGEGETADIFGTDEGTLHVHCMYICTCIYCTCTM